MSNKVVQIIPSRDLLAVIKCGDNFYTLKVSCIELVEDFSSDEHGTRTITRRERPVFPYRGKLVNGDDVPSFLGAAESKLWAELVFTQSISPKKHKAYFDRIKAEEKEKYRWLDWKRDNRVEPVIEEMVAN